MGSVPNFLGSVPNFLPQQQEIWEVSLVFSLVFSIFALSTIINYTIKILSLVKLNKFNFLLLTIQYPVVNPSSNPIA